MNKEKRPDLYYYSESSDKYILIKKMTDRHILNAINKLKRYVVYSYKEGKPKTVENMIVVGRGSDHPVYEHLCNEMEKRIIENRLTYGLSRLDYDYVLEDYALEDRR